jgi:hypothetical protein
LFVHDEALDDIANEEPHRGFADARRELPELLLCERQRQHSNPYL